jgi:hypothetical protein
LKQRTFTLLATRYDQVRRAMSFLRWNEGDFEELAPSLYIGRNNGGRKKRARVEGAKAGNVAAEGQGATLAVEAQAASAGSAQAPAERPATHGGSAGEDTGRYARAALDTLPPVMRSQEPPQRAESLHQEAGAFTPKFLKGS